MGSIKLKNEGIISKETETKQVQTEEIKVISEPEIAESVGQSGTDFDDPAILYKDESRTDVYSEHYVMNNGTAKTVISAKPVNYYDEETKKWEKIDLTAKEKDGYYESRAGSVAARFSKTDAETDAQKVEMVSGKQTISWEYVGKASDGTIKPIKKAAALRINKSEDKSETAVYEEAESNTDIEYAFDGKNLKENIIVREKSNQYKYNFIMDTHGLNVRLSENNDSIEVYTAEDKAKGIEEKVEFYIPSPVMWDAEGNTSEEVYYEIGKSADGKYEFSVIASEEWINAEERVFPVTIDPQIITGFGGAISFQVQRRSISDYGSGTIYGEWEDVIGCSNIKVSINNNTEYRTIITINRNQLSIQENCIVKAEMVLRPISNSTGMISINGYHVIYNTAYGDLVHDITNIFSGNEPNLIIELSIPQGLINIDYNFSIGSWTPILEIEYLINENFCPTIKTFSFAGSTEGKVNLATGDMTISFNDVQENNFIYGFTIDHIYKNGSDDYYLGKNFRLNLHETFIKNERELLDANYIYTDAYGDKYGFKDYYYYFDDSGNKVYVVKKNISVEADGTLKYNEHIIYAEYRSTTGLKALTRLEGVKYVSYYDQRSDELKQLEEKIENYGNALKEFVVLHVDNGQICNRFSDYLISVSRFEWLINELAKDEYIVLTESEALTYSSLLLQLNGLNYQMDSYDHQRTGFNLSKISMQRQIDTITNTKVLDSNYNNTSWQTNINNDIKQNLSNQINLTTNQDGTIQDIKYNTLLQRNNINETLNVYRNKKGKYITQINAYYKIYYAALDDQQKQNRSIPINFLTDDKIIKGYNIFGDLVLIQDGYNNYSIIEYEPVDGSAAHYRIARIFDNFNRVINFSYSADNKLSCVTDFFGKRVKYEYTDDKLTKVKYDIGKEIEFEYDGGKITVVKDKQYERETDISYWDGRPGGFRNVSLAGTISSGQISEPIDNSNTLFDSLVLSFTQNSNLTMNNVVLGNSSFREKFSFSSEDNNLIAYEKEENWLVVYAERYEYIPYWIGNIQQSNPRKVIIKADKSTYYSSNFSGYSFVAGETEYSVLNQFNNPITTTVSGIKLNADGTNTLTSVTTYIYDHNQKVIEERTSEQYTNLQNPIVSYVRYNYNAAGDVIRKESFVAGEEYTNGKTVEETVYDDKGNVIKTFTYNTLDASSKYYTEKMFDENGNVISEANDSGENFTEYEYAENSGELNTVKHVNGSKFSYGRDADGTVISITQSDENGEGNSTELSYTCGELTKATSGNNTVKYTYDGKRRVTQIDLNGTEEYLKNTYIDNVTHYNLNLNYVETENKKEEKFKRWFYKSGEVKQVDYNNDTVLLYDFNAKMQVTSVSDSVASITHTYLYDALDRQIKHSFGTSSIETEFDAFGSVSKTTYKFSAADSDKVEYTFTYSEDSKRMLKSLAVGAFTEDYKTDALGRTKTVVKTFGNKTYGTSYGYYKAGDHATNLINTIYRLQDGITKDKITYTYDGMGNIISVNENGRQKYKYNYDKLGRLLSEIDVLNDNKEIVYTYDNKGNILTKTEEGNTIHYTYEEGTDKLLSYGNESFVYDVIGNPTTFRNMTATWNKGRQLTSLNNGTNTVTYTYDGFGLRKSKTVGGVTTEYIYAGGKLLRQTGSNTIDFIYGADGITGIKVNNDYSYLFMKNIQGDVEKIISADGTVVGEYAYTAFGKCTIITNTDNIAEINPIRYRGYYYDEETSLYYLKSRYYDPELGRFMTIDDISYIDIETINGLNLYAYCGNNPITGYDPDGNWDWGKFWKIVGIVVGTAVFVVAVVASAGTVGALAGVGAAAIGLSTTAVSAITTIATVATYTVATGIALFGISDAIEIGTDGFNPIRDVLMGENQSLYDTLKITFNVLGSLAVIAGTVGPKVLQGVAKKGFASREGFKKDFFDKNDVWNLRIDATVHGNPKYHYNPHIHIIERSGHGRAVKYFWQVIKGWLKK